MGFPLESPRLQSGLPLSQVSVPCLGPPQGHTPVSGMAMLLYDNLWSSEDINHTKERTTQIQPSFLFTLTYDTWMQVTRTEPFYSLLWFYSLILIRSWWKSFKALSKTEFLNFNTTDIWPNNSWLWEAVLYITWRKQHLWSAPTRYQ